MLPWRGAWHCWRRATQHGALLARGTNNPLCKAARLHADDHGMGKPLHVSVLAELHTKYSYQVKAGHWLDISSCIAVLNVPARRMCLCQQCLYLEHWLTLLSSALAHPAHIPRAKCLRLHKILPCPTPTDRVAHLTSLQPTGSPTTIISSTTSCSCTSCTTPPWRPCDSMGGCVI